MRGTKEWFYEHEMEHYSLFIVKQIGNLSPEISDHAL
jgi:hypothetical protein